MANTSASDAYCPNCGRQLDDDDANYCARCVSRKGLAPWLQPDHDGVVLSLERRGLEADRPYWSAVLKLDQYLKFPRAFHELRVEVTYTSLPDERETPSHRLCFLPPTPQYTRLVRNQEPPVPENVRLLVLRERYFRRGSATRLSITEHLLQEDSTCFDWAIEGDQDSDEGSITFLATLLRNLREGWSEGGRPKGAVSPILEEQKDREAAEMARLIRGQGLTITQVARRFNCSDDTVRRRLARLSSGDAGAHAATNRS